MVPCESTTTGPKFEALKMESLIPYTIPEDILLPYNDNDQFVLAGLQTIAYAERKDENPYVKSTRLWHTWKKLPTRKRREPSTSAHSSKISKCCGLERKDWYADNKPWEEHALGGV